jgi:endonuclease YncB( thermonuclease family)
MKRLAIALVLVALPAWAQNATVVDGDRIDVGGTAYRLLGVDAPDGRQICDDGYPAGQEAIRVLRNFLQGHRIACEAHGKDIYGRIVALCRADGRDVGEAMVRAGMAWADPATGRSYVDVEHDAQADRLGVHDHTCVLPWAYRKDPR